MHKRVWNSIRNVREGVPELAMGATVMAEPMPKERWLPYQTAKEICNEHKLYRGLEVEDRVTLTNLIRRMNSEERVKVLLEIFNLS